MTHSPRFRSFILAASVAVVIGPMMAGCQTDSREQILATDKSQVELRSIQTRVFDTADKSLTVRNVIATLQDLGFVVDKVDDGLGTVSGTKVQGYAMRITVTVRPRGNTQMAVRANAQYNINAVSDAAPYQQFFAALEKAMFLNAQQVD